MRRKNDVYVIYPPPRELCKNCLKCIPIQKKTLHYYMLEVEDGKTRHVVAENKEHVISIMRRHTIYQIQEVF